MTSKNILTQSTAPLSEERKRAMLNGSYPYIYRSENGVDLTAYCFFPDGKPPKKDATEYKPTIIFFHGGLWDVSLVTQFSPHAMHFASRGMVAIVVEYRVSSLHSSTPEQAFEDTQMAMQWLKHSYQELGVDPNRIVAAGSAAGAYMALSLAMRKKQPVIGCYTPHPQAVIAISAVVSTHRRNIDLKRFPNAKQSTRNNPNLTVRRKLPPCLMVHGKSDTIAPHFLVEDFTRQMRRKRNRCELIDFDACNHSFFNFNVSPKHFEITLNTMDAFICDLGYIEPTEYSL